MTEFVESPIFDNWFKKHFPKKSLWICTPYMKQSALNRLIELYGLDEGLNIELQVLIRGNTEEFTYNRSSDISIFDTFIDMPGFDILNFRRLSNLHMKAYLIDEKELLITSGNLTNSGMFAISMTENFEGGIATNDPKIVEQFIFYFMNIWNQSEGLTLFYDDIINAYALFAASEHDGNRQIPKRRKYVFPQYMYPSPLQPKVSKRKYALSDLPSAKIDTLIDTLDVLYKSDEPLTMELLGKQLRILHGLDNIDNPVSNKKYGEEKGNLAVFFGLVHKIKNGAYEFSLSTMGQCYLEFSLSQRFAYITEQIRTKEVLCDILANRDKPKFDLREYVYSVCEGTHKTLNRKISPIQSLVDLYDGKGITSL